MITYMKKALPLQLERGAKKAMNDEVWSMQDALAHGSVHPL